MTTLHLLELTALIKSLTEQIASGCDGAADQLLQLRPDIEADVDEGSY